MPRIIFVIWLTSLVATVAVVVRTIYLHVPNPFVMGDEPWYMLLRDPHHLTFEVVTGVVLDVAIWAAAWLFVKAHIHRDIKRGHGEDELAEVTDALTVAGTVQRNSFRLDRLEQALNLPQFQLTDMNGPEPLSHVCNTGAHLFCDGCGCWCHKGDGADVELDEFVKVAQEAVDEQQPRMMKDAYGLAGAGRPHPERQGCEAQGCVPVPEGEC